MERTHGSEGVALVECINPRYRKYRVRWDVQPYVNDEGESQGVTFVETEFKHKPSIAEVKDVVLGWMNKQIDDRILSGFEWNGMKIWLSSENQFNYKAAYDLAVQTNGMNLPVTFKFGDAETPVYHKFSTISEMSDFYFQSISYINNQLTEGWKEKDSFDWSGYEALLSE
jgi:hypothetical protein